MSKKLFSELIRWSSEQYSHLPWREKRSLYGTLVSEIMLQQTTVGTVLNHFERFLKEYPTIFDLARASEEQVCISWKGLGYYRRARNLRNLAQQIVERFDGEIPTDIDSLMTLKGIGPYTANAIVAIGADKPGLAVDANLERVLARFYGDKTPKGAKLQQKLHRDFKAGVILPDIKKLGPRALNEALMDLGRILCQARKASCTLCPLKKDCAAHQSGKPLIFPVGSVEKKKAEDFFIKLLRVVVIKEGQVLFYQKKESEWLAGQWELPSFIIETNDDKIAQYPRLKSKWSFEKDVIIKTGITKYSIENIVVQMDLEEFLKLTRNVSSNYIFKQVNGDLNLSTASMKALQHFHKKKIK